MNTDSLSRNKFVQEKGPLIINSLEKTIGEMFSEKLGKIYFQDLSNSVCSWETVFLNGRILSVCYNLHTKKVMLHVSYKRPSTAVTKTWSVNINFDENFEQNLKYFLQGKI